MYHCEGLGYVTYQGGVVLHGPFFTFLSRTSFVIPCYKRKTVWHTLISR